MAWSLAVMAATSLPAIAATENAVLRAHPAATGGPIRVLIVDGFSNHDWRRTTDLVQGILLPAGLFEISVCTAPASVDEPGASEWCPDFAACDVVIQNCNSLGGGSSWPAGARAAFERFVTDGGGVFILHSANNAFSDWPAYDRFIGLGWRSKDRGWALEVQPDGALRHIPPGEGAGTSHGARTDRVIHRVGDHPIHAGLPRRWMTPEIEVYTHARGPAENLTLLSWAADPATGTRWPIEWVVAAGQGRIYNSTFGHVWRNEPNPSNLRCAGFQTILVRALQWLAKRPVTLPVPEDFPGEDAPVLRALPLPGLPAETLENRWRIETPLLEPGPPGAFDETAVKDPSIVRYGGRWHVFYTARGRGEYTTGYVSAADLSDLPRVERHELTMIRGQTSRYGCAPQVFRFAPQGLWYLLFQTRDANYQPGFATTSDLLDPESWSAPRPLLAKDDPAKWIDFWVICDEARAYLFYTRSHREVWMRSTALEDFPDGWGPAREVFAGVHEAVHVYRVKDRPLYHLFYELNTDGIRSFGVAEAASLQGPWKKVADAYAAGEGLATSNRPAWTEMVSHGELLHSGNDQRLEYDPEHVRWLIQGLRKAQYQGDYAELPWRLGLMTK